MDTATTGTTRAATSVGQSLRRREDPRLLKGLGKYLDDIQSESVLHARFVRASQAHAVIRSIDATEARALPGVVAVLTAEDLHLGPLVAPLNIPDAPSVPRPILASDRIRFSGEPLALVVAETAYIAEDGQELVSVESEPLDVVLSVSDALGSESPRLHALDSNVLFERNFSEGDVEAAFRNADITLEREFVSPRQTPLPMETRGILAQPTQNGLTVHASTQIPHILRRALAAMLHLDSSDVHVHCPDIGGGFGQKAHVYPEEIAVCAAAKFLNRPIKWVEDRIENLMAASHARGQVVHVKVAANRDGRVLAVDADVVCDIGAYGVFAHGQALEAAGTAAMIPGPYRLPAYRYRTRAVATNKCPGGAYRGVGLPVATFVHERIMDLVAGACDLLPSTVRQRNLLHSIELPYVSITGHRYDSGDYHKALSVALDAIEYDSFQQKQSDCRRQGRLIGVGIACYVEYTAVNSAAFAERGQLGLPGFDSAHVELQDDGTIHVWTSLAAIGQGTETTFAQLAADALNLPVDTVIVRRADTSQGNIDGTGTFASRSAASGGGAVLAACVELRADLLKAAADALEIDTSDLELRDNGVGVVGMPGISVTLADIAARSTSTYTASQQFDPPAVFYPYGTHACVVEVDPETGIVTILEYVVVEDCGTLINPLIVNGQVHGAVAQGIAGALYETMLYDDSGQLQTSTLMDYLIPTATEIPRIQVEHLAIPAPDSPTGAKGVGEAGTLGPGAAIANAIGNALDGECNSLPASPPMVRTLVQSFSARQDFR